MASPSPCDLQFCKPSLAWLVELSIPSRARAYFRGYWPVVECVYLLTDRREPNGDNYLAIRFAPWAAKKMLLAQQLRSQFFDECQSWIPRLKGGVAPAQYSKWPDIERVGEIIFDGL